jgi:hypothetical protein
MPQMTPNRYRECLDMLSLSQRGLAPILQCPDRPPRAWATGKETVPPAIAAWLEAWVTTRLANPDPPPPKTWRRRRKA